MEPALNVSPAASVSRTASGENTGENCNALLGPIDTAPWSPHAHITEPLQVEGYKVSKFFQYFLSYSLHWNDPIRTYMTYGISTHFGL